VDVDGDQQGDGRLSRRLLLLVVVVSVVSGGGRGAEARVSAGAGTVGVTETETFPIYRCPHCGTVTEGWPIGPRYCAGNQWGMEKPLEAEKGDHPSVEMERLTVRVVEP
jgi:hypothetical protein